MQIPGNFGKLAQHDIKAARKIAEKLACENSLYVFVQNAWKWFDPQPFRGGWHIEALCLHLEAVTCGDIKRLLVNIPPGTSKSSIVAVCWPAWVWAQRDIGHLSGPQVQFMFNTYSQNLSERDSMKMRTLIESEWYQGQWGDKFQILEDNKRKFSNNRLGYRLSTSVSGTATGDGGKIIVVDDPHNAKDVNSEAMRNEVRTWWTETMPTRLRDQENGAKVIIMQRLHQEDLSGYILDNNADGEWVHLCLPMRYDPEMHCATEIGWEDPRTEPGELLCPERYNERALYSIEKELGSYGTAGQMQQRPSPKGGGIIKREHWQLWPPEDWPDDAPVAFPLFEFLIASIDTAYTEKTENDYSACVIFGIFRDKNGYPKVMLIDAWKERLSLRPLVEKILNTAQTRQIDALLVENKASGISIMQEIARLCRPGEFQVVPINPGSQDKVARAYACQSLFEANIVYAPDRQYADMVITECENFPKGKHDDLVDAVTQGLLYLRRIGLALISNEAHEELLQERMFKSATTPISQIYGV